MSTNPKVFISYSWDADFHKEWVKNLADKLIENGVIVILDQYDCPPGTNFPYFMEQSVENADKTLVVLTENYAQKTNNRVRGVGYETSIISAEVYVQAVDARRFIPILRKGDHRSATPIFMRAITPLDMRSEENFEGQFEVLLKTIFNHSDKPTIGKTPKFTVNLGSNTFSPSKKISNNEKRIKINQMIVDNEMETVCNLLIQQLGGNYSGHIVTVILRDFKEIQRDFQTKSMSKHKKQEEETKVIDRLLSFLQNLKDIDLNEIELDS
ncbi:MAG: toll/interleukin-1 receptor domain-containing protein [Saprospiraceae bacterium]